MAARHEELRHENYTLFDCIATEGVSNDGVGAGKGYGNRIGERHGFGHNIFRGCEASGYFFLLIPKVNSVIGWASDSSLPLQTYYVL